MDNLTKDLIRLNLLSGTILAEERLSPSILIKDFTHYYFSRFVMNLKHVFSHFTTDQLSDFNRRHERALKIFYLKSTLSNPTLTVPVPKGMVDPYRLVVDRLANILFEINAGSLAADLKALTHVVETATSVTIDHPMERQQFEQLKSVVAHQFSPVGLHYSTASHALGSVTDIKYVNEQLSNIVRLHYPNVFDIESTLKTLDHLFTKTAMDHQTKQAMSSPLLNLAYRLSLFAVVMDHIQELEYNFVEALALLLKSEPL